MNKDLKKLIKGWRDCAICPLGADPRCKSHVFYRGDAPCDVLFIGEAPGKDENLVGLPFIGRAGDILDELIKDAAEEIVLCQYGFENYLDWELEDAKRLIFSYGITNIVCCIPIADKVDEEDGGIKIRVPNKKEAKACSPRLIRTIQIAQPKLIVLLGKVAQQFHPASDPKVSQIPVLELDHPMYIGYNGGIGSITYDKNLVRLAAGLEDRLYGKEAKAQGSKKKAAVKKAKRKKRLRRQKDEEPF